MAATKQEIVSWFKRGVTKGATHMIVVCDTFDWNDYPVFAKTLTEAHVQVTAHNGPNMQRVMEVYDLHADMDEQLAEHRAWRLPPEPADVR